MTPWKHHPARDLGLSEVERLRSLRRESGLVSTALHLAWWWGVQKYLTRWHGLTVEGAHHLPADPPYVLVANHTSHLDALVLASHLPWQQRDRVFPIAAGDVFFETPATSAFAAWMLNALPMWRKKCGRQALVQLRERLVSEPCAYILFPEGTRSRDGRLAPFKAGLGTLVAETRVPVIPCHLEGCFEALGPRSSWPRPTPIRLRIGAPLVFEHVANHRAGWEEIAAQTQRSVEGLSVAHSSSCARPPSKAA